MAVRQVHDGEPFYVQAQVDRRTPSDTWWRAELVAHNTVSNYRFLLDGGSTGYRWLSAAGVVEADVPDGGDFRVALASEVPAWLDDAIVYQMLPDRFARSGRVTEPLPDWAVPAAWDDAPKPSGRPAAQQFFGGDLYGVAEHLDHIASLGANTLYLTPVFPAASSHRYNATSFDHIDPLLGGDAAYRELIDTAHARGMRVLGDLTTNHTGQHARLVPDRSRRCAVPGVGLLPLRPGHGRRRGAATTSGGSGTGPCPSSTTAAPSCAAGWSTDRTASSPGGSGSASTAGASMWPT